MKNKKIILLFPILLGIIPALNAMFNLQKPKKQVLFISNVAQKKAQLKKLTKELDEYKKETTKTIEELKKETDATSKELLDITKQKKETKEKHKIEHLNKKNTFFTEQKQILLSLQSILKNIEEKHTNRLRIAKEAISFLEGKLTKKLKEAYTWEELRLAQEVTSKITEKTKRNKNKLTILQKSKTTEEDTITSLKKQIEVKQAERDKALAQLKEKAKLETAENRDLAENISLTENIFNIEIETLKKKIQLSEFKIKELIQAIKLKKERISLLEKKHNQDKKNLETIEQRIIITKKDINDAKNQANQERQIALNETNILNKRKTNVQYSKIKLESKIDTLNQKIKKLKDERQEETIQYYLIASEQKHLESQHLSLEREISKINTQINLLDAKAKEKELWHDRINLRRNLTMKKQDFSEPLAKFTSKKDEESFTYEKAQETAKKFLETQRKFFSQENLDTSTLIEYQEKIIKQYYLILAAIEAQKIEQNIWERSPKAISFKGFKTSLFEAERYFKKLFWDTPAHLGPSVILSAIGRASVHDMLALLFFILFFLLLFFIIRHLLLMALKKAKQKLAIDHKHVSFLPLNIAVSFIDFALKHLILITLWSFIFLHIVFDFKYVFYSLRFFAKPYFISMFYLITIPIMLHLSRHLLLRLKELNKQLSFLFFAEKLQDRFILLITSFCFSTAILIPLKRAFLAYFAGDPTIFPSVMKAAYSLVLIIILLLFFSKEDVLRIIPSRFAFLVWIKKQIEKHYYPVFFFLMGLLILSNPYIGYSNLSWYLAFAIPTSTLLIYGLFIAHYSIRKYAVFMFVKEEEEEIIDKFEHAKTYYGIFVIFSFITLSILTFMLVSRIWGYEYSLIEMWKALSERWVIPISHEYNLGFVQLFSLILFIVVGFFISSIIHRFILNKLFEILRTEPGTQNTFSKILHYTIISIAMLLGLISIHLESIFWYLGTFLGVAVGLATKDLVSDYKDQTQM